MSVDERRRLELADAAKRVFGDDAGITLMELLPPVGWADVATKRDLDALEARLELHLEARLERGFRQIVVTVSALMVGGFLATVAATIAAALIR